MKKTLAKVFGWVLIVVGVLGFFSNPIIGKVGYFHANVAHTVIHLLLGIIFLLVASTEESAGLWLKIMGVVVLVVAILGFMSGTGTILGFIETPFSASYSSCADSWEDRHQQAHRRTGFVLEKRPVSAPAGGPFSYL